MRWPGFRPTRRTGSAPRISCWSRATRSNVGAAAIGALPTLPVRRPRRAPFSNIESPMSDKGERRASGWMGLAIAGVAGIAIGALVMLLLGGGIGDERIKRVVRETLMEQPEILPEAMAELNRKDAAAAIGPRRAEFETP